MISGYGVRWHIELVLGPALTNYAYDVSGAYATILAAYVMAIIVMVVVFRLVMRKEA